MAVVAVVRSTEPNLLEHHLVDETRYPYIMRSPPSCCLSFVSAATTSVGEILVGAVSHEHAVEGVERLSGFVS